MPSFSKHSLARLETCDDRLIAICNRVIKCMDFTVVEGHRPNESQEIMFNTGRSKLRAGMSRHNREPSMAVDVAPYRNGGIDWDSREHFILLAGHMFQAASELGVQLRWGGDWDGDLDFKDQSFNDLPHFEIVGD